MQVVDFDEQNVSTWRCSGVLCKDKIIDDISITKPIKVYRVAVAMVTNYTSPAAGHWQWINWFKFVSSANSFRYVLRCMRRMQALLRLQYRSARRVGEATEFRIRNSLWIRPLRAHGAGWKLGQGDEAADWTWSWYRLGIDVCYRWTRGGDWFHGSILWFGRHHHFDEENWIGTNCLSFLDRARDGCLALHYCHILCHQVQSFHFSFSATRFTRFPLH